MWRPYGVHVAVTGPRMRRRSGSVEPGQATESLKALGLEKHQALIVTHRGGHPHVIVNRVDAESAAALGRPLSRRRVDRGAGRATQKTDVVHQGRLQQRQYRRFGRCRCRRLDHPCRSHQNNLCLCRVLLQKHSTASWPALCTDVEWRWNLPWAPVWRSAVKVDAGNRNCHPNSTPARWATGFSLRPIGRARSEPRPSPGPASTGRPRTESGGRRSNRRPGRARVRA